MRPARAAATLLLLGTLASCGPPDAEPLTGEELVEQARDALEELAPETEPDAGAPEPGQPPGGPSEGETGSGDAEPPSAVEQPAAPVDDRAGLGGLCRAYLRPEVPRLVVEVAHQRGVAPSPSALDHLAATLRGVVDKPGGVSLTTVEIPGEARTWTRDDLEAASRRHRQAPSGTDQLVMHVLALRGAFEERDALGVAFDASSFAIFPERIDGLATLLGGSAAIQRAVLVHEAGHLLCLVNITYRSDIDHEDPEHPGHSRDRASVMYWAVDNSAIAQVFTGPPPSDFNANDRDDLEGQRTGRY